MVDVQVALQVYGVVLEGGLQRAVLAAAIRCEEAVRAQIQTAQAAVLQREVGGERVVGVPLLLDRQTVVLEAVRALEERGYLAGVVVRDAVHVELNADRRFGLHIQLHHADV